jgi:hypothetical protein
MATLARLVFCEKGYRTMSKNLRRASTAATAGNVPAQVRVGLKRINCQEAEPKERHRDECRISNKFK